MPKRGRPKLGIQIKRIGLQAPVYDEWIRRKETLGFSGKSNSDFAKYLLRTSEEPSRRDLVSSSPAIGKYVHTVQTVNKVGKLV